MLTQILEVLRATERPQTLEALSQKMAVEQSALEGMLTMLVHKGKIHKITPAPLNAEKGAFLCKGCQTKTHCAEALERPTYYTLVNTDA